jgi:hypothetical protein
VSSDCPRSRSMSSKLGHSGTPSRLLSGRKSISRRICSSASTSFSNAPSATPDLVVCTTAPPSSSCRHHLVGDGLHHVGAGDEHVARVLHHEDEVGHRRRIDVAARARAHDHADLRDHARGEHVALEHLGIAAERRDAFLDARAAGVVEADDRRAAFIAMSWTLQIFCAWVSTASRRTR